MNKKILIRLATPASNTFVISIFSVSIMRKADLGGIKDSIYLSRKDTLTQLVLKLTSNDDTK